MSTMHDENNHEPEKPVFADYSQENKDFMRNPTDFSDPVAEQRRKHKIKIITITIASILALAALILLPYYLLHKSNGNSNSTQQQTPAPTSTQQINATNPLAKIYKNAPQVSQGNVSIQVNKDGTAQASNGQKISFDGRKLNNPSNPCSVTQPSDYCLVANYKKDNEVFNLYYMKDAIRSRLFEGEQQSFTPTTIRGSSAAGTMRLTIGKNQQNAIIISNPDASGWIVIVEKGDPNSIAKATKIN